MGIKLVMAGIVTEAEDCTLYFDGESFPGVELTLNQEGYEAWENQRGSEYYPPKIRFMLQRLQDGVPPIGSRVRVLTETDVRRGSGQNAGKNFVNLLGRSLEVLKA